MSFDLKSLTLRIAAQGSVVRVLIAKVEGSAPREAGTAMLVWAEGQSGTIGGGALEYEAAIAARKMLNTPGKTMLNVEALGPALGQCCGGSVTLAYEVFDQDSVQKLASDSDKTLYLRKIDPTADNKAPGALLRLAQRHKNGGDDTPATSLASGWLAEPLQQNRAPVWIYGGGHVGRALAATLAPLRIYEISILDTANDRFPDPMPQNTNALLSPNPADLVPHAPENAHHFIMTYSHTMDLEICHRLLEHRFASVGLIGSHTKWVRFRKRLLHLGHSPERISSITCPIGDPALGKHPQAIAIGVAAALIRTGAFAESEKDVA